MNSRKPQREGISGSNEVPLFIVAPNLFNFLED